MSEQSTPKQGVLSAFNMSNKTYDRLKWIALFFLPAFGALYFALSGIWALPYGEQVLGMVVAVETFLGAILGLSKANYVRQDLNFDGTILFDHDDPDKDLLVIQPHIGLETIEEKSVATFRVVSK